MNRYVCLAVGCSLLSGCFVSSSRRDDVRVGDIAVVWRLLEGVNSREVACNPEDTVGVIVEDVAGELVAAECFVCDDEGAIIGTFPDGEYDVYLQLSDLPISDCRRLATPEAESSISRVLIDNDAATPPEFDILTDVGFVDVSWSFVGLPLLDGCAALGADTFRAVALVAGQEIEVDGADFDCEDGEGTLPLLEVGAYDVEGELFGGGVAVPLSAILVEDVSIRFGGDVDLVDFPAYPTE